MPKQITASSKLALDRMNRASQMVGGLGTLFLGQALVPDVGILSCMATLEYKIAPALASNTAVHANVTCPTSGTTTVTTAITNPDVPRLLVVKGNQATVTGNVVINGTDINDAVITETIASNGTSAVESTKAFKTVTSFVIPTRGAASDAISIGTSAKVGMPLALDNAKQFQYATFDGSDDAGTLTAGTTVPTTVYAAAGTFDGAKLLKIVFLG